MITRSTQPSIPPGSVNEYQLKLGRQRQLWLIPIADERVGVQLTLFRPFGKLHVACFLGSNGPQVRVATFHNGPQVRVATFHCFVTGIFETFVAADSK